VKTRDRSSFFEAAAYAVGGTFGVAMAMGGLLVVVSVAIFIITEFGDKIINWISTYELNDVIIYMVSWILLLAISISAAWEIQHTLGSASQNYRRRRALAISLIIGLVLTVILFKQPYLDAVFGGDGVIGLRVRSGVTGRRLPSKLACTGSEIRAKRASAACGGQP
jgi:hypothetical protein